MYYGISHYLHNLVSRRSMHVHINLYSRPYEIISLYSVLVNKTCFQAFIALYSMPFNLTTSIIAWRVFLNEFNVVFPLKINHRNLIKLLYEVKKSICIDQMNVIFQSKSTTLGNDSGKNNNMQHIGLFFYCIL